MIVKVNIPKKIFDRLANKDRTLTIKDIDIALGALCRATVVSNSYTWEEDTRPECNDCCYCVCKTTDSKCNEKLCAMGTIPENVHGLHRQQKY